MSSVGVIAGLFVLVPTNIDPPRGVVALDFLIALGLDSGSRFPVRAAVERPTRAAHDRAGRRARY